MEQMLQTWIDLATSSPSGGNAQPWAIEYKFDLDKIHIKISIDETYRRKQSPMDLDGSAAVIALGCFGKGLEIAASFDQYSPIFKKVEGSAVWGSTIIYVFQKTENKTPPLYSRELLLKRRTNREPYFSKDITNDFKQDIKRILERYPNIQYTVTSNKDKNLINCWERLEKLRFRNKYLIKSIVDEVNITQKPRGLPITQLGISSPDMFLLILLKTFLSFFYMFKFGGYLIAIKKGVTKPITSASMFGLITPKENTPENLVSLGEFFLEYWIVTNAKDLSLHPMCNSLLLYNMFIMMGQDVLNDKEMAEARAIHQKMLDQFGVDLKKPTVAFRVGFAKTCTERSPRAKIIPVRFS